MLGGCYRWCTSRTARAATRLASPTGWRRSAAPCAVRRRASARMKSWRRSVTWTPASPTGPTCATSAAPGSPATLIPTTTNDNQAVHQASTAGLPFLSAAVTCYIINWTVRLPSVHGSKDCIAKANTIDICIMLSLTKERGARAGYEVNRINTQGS